MPVAGGRAARRRAAEASGVIDPDSTEVLTGLHALREPSRDEPSRPPAPGAAEVTAITRVRRSGGASHGPEGTRDRDDPDDPEQLGHLDDPDDLDDLDDEDADREPPGWAARLPARPVLAAVAVVVALAVVAVVAAVTGSTPTPAPAPAAVVDATTSAPAAAPPAIDPESAQAVAFLTALRDADIPTSRSGQAETEAAAVICQQLEQGADEASLVRTLPAVLPDLTRSQAADVVEHAQEHYC
jgi:hypothetical protein